MTAGCVQEVKVCNPKGLHARPAAQVARLVQTFAADVTVIYNGEEAEADSIMDLLMLGAAPGAALCVCATGPEAEEAASAVADLIKSGFGEI